MLKASDEFLNAILVVRQRDKNTRAYQLRRLIIIPHQPQRTEEQILEPRSFDSGELSAILRNISGISGVKREEIIFQLDEIQVKKHPDAPWDRIHVGVIKYIRDFYPDIGTIMGRIKLVEEPVKEEIPQAAPKEPGFLDVLRGRRGGKNTASN